MLCIIFPGFIHNEIDFVWKSHFVKYKFYYKLTNMRIDHKIIKKKKKGKRKDKYSPGTCNKEWWWCIWRIKWIDDENKIKFQLSLILMLNILRCYNRSYFHAVNSRNMCHYISYIDSHADIIQPNTHQLLALVLGIQLEKYILT